MKEIIEDTISRNRKFQEERNAKVNRLKAMQAPPVLIEYEEMIAGMTIAEYEIHLEQLEKEDTGIKAEYAKNNLIQKHIVDEIYSRVEKLNYDYFMYISDFNFVLAVNPLKFMSQEDFDNDLYKTFLDHAQKIYHEKYLADYNNSEKLNVLGDKE